MASSGEIDILFDVRNNYYIGAYQGCINEAQNLKTRTESEILLKDIFLYRAYIALNKFSIPLGEIDPVKAQLPLRAIRRFAEFMSAKSDGKTKILSELTTELESGKLENDEMNILMASLIFIQTDNVEDALRALNFSEASSSLECQAAQVQCLLKLNRPDIALKTLKKMQEIDEDCTITQLATAWVNMALGREKIKDAFYIYQEMIDKYGSYPPLLVSKASCLILQAKYEEAESDLQEAIQKDPSNADAIIGLMAVSQFLGKSDEIINRYLNQIKQDFPNHPWTKVFQNKEIEFERLTNQKH